VRTEQKLIFMLGFVLMGAAPTYAQKTNEPEAEAHKVDRAPMIDGRLNEAIWESAIPLDGFRQRDPSEGDAATEPTRIRIIYDEASLYIGAELSDSEPSQIRASELRRDNTLESDDSFSVLLDTFYDHRNAFVFRVNPRGTRYDAQIRNENRFFLGDWDEQWTAAATMTEAGWAVEMAIPFKVLRFSGAKDQVWGLNFERVLKRKNEFSYWAGWTRDFAFYNVSQAGRLIGLQDIKQQERIRLRPYIIAAIQDFNAPATSDRRWKNKMGIDDLKLVITPSLIADLTVNPDFAQTEVDAQQVNLTRFNLSFPEKRQFFIESSDTFRFSVAYLHFGPPPLELFYSRNIGLSENGEPIPVRGGGKLTWKTGGFDIGFLNAQTSSYLGKPAENFAVARMKREVLGRSYVGAILTNREGAGARNRVAGADARFVFKRYLNVAGLVAKSATQAGGSKNWFRQAGFQWVDDKIEGGMNYIHGDPNFDPGVGFVRRKDRLIGASFMLKPRPGGKLVRQFEITPSASVNHADGGTLLTRLTRIQLAANFQSGDRIQLNAANTLDRLPGQFNVGPGVTLPPDVYQFNDAGVTVQTYNGRKLSGNATWSAGRFYNGTKRAISLAGETRPNKNVSFNPTYSFNNIDLVQGSFDTHLFGLRSNVSFSTSLLTSAYLQYNSAGNLAAMQFRLNYIFRTIDNFYIVYNDTHFNGGPFDGKSNRSLVLKMTYSVQR
jgi:hypothetical protein